MQKKQVVLTCFFHSVTSKIIIIINPIINEIVGPLASPSLADGTNSSTTTYIIQPAAIDKQKGNILFTSHDHEFVQTIADRIIELTPGGVFDKFTTYDDFLADEELQKRLAAQYENK